MVVGMGMGPFKSVALYDFDTMKEAFARDEFQGRPESYIMTYRTGGKIRGIVSNQGPDHKLHRTWLAMLQLTCPVLPMHPQLHPTDQVERRGSMSRV